MKGSYFVACYLWEIKDSILIQSILETWKYKFNIFSASPWSLFFQSVDNLGENHSCLPIRSLDKIWIGDKNGIGETVSQRQRKPERDTERGKYGGREGEWNIFSLVFQCFLSNGLVLPNLITLEKLCLRWWGVIVKYFKRAKKMY